MQNLLSILSFSLLVLTACGPALHPSSTPLEQQQPVEQPLADSALVPSADKCLEPPGNTSDHSVFAILSDGSEVGREVRSAWTVEGPYGPERLMTSHVVERMKMGLIQFEKRSVKMEQSDAVSGRLYRASRVDMDQLVIRTAIVYSTGDSWERLVSSRSSLTDPHRAPSEPLDLTGDEVIGMRLYDHLSSWATGRQSPPPSIVVFEPMLKRPANLTVSEPVSDAISIDGMDIPGRWYELSKPEDDRVVVRAFLDERGMLWSEEYPELHQVRRRLPGNLTLEFETSELLVGLHSEAYLADPNRATHARYRLTSTPDRLDALGLLEASSTHTVQRISPTVLELRVVSGAPDGTSAPTSEDLASTPYIRPNAPSIRSALRYLRSSGKRGSLPVARRLNTTEVIARTSFIRSPKRFWSDPDQVAGLIMHYVSALLPDKRHTFSMSDAETTLDRGAGDCTEHSVLFASLMRAHGIPTRLVSGMYLTRGGMWGYHMWNSYWNGSTWQSIDVASKVYRPGALHVALGRGVSRFDTIRDELGDFIRGTFSGVQFDLVEAGDAGQSLYLARPRAVGQNLQETALFNAVVLSSRGDHEEAISVLDDNIPSDSRTLTVKLMRVELLVRAARHDEALSKIAEIRRETSLPSNTYLLDKLELECLLEMRRYEDAATAFERIRNSSSPSSEEFSILEARYLFALNRSPDCLEPLSRSLASNPDATAVKIAFADIVARLSPDLSSSLFAEGVTLARDAIVETMSADRFSLLALSRLLLQAGDIRESYKLIEHALILAPADRDLLSTRDAIERSMCR